MKRFISASLVACLSVVLSGALIGCHASADVDPDRTSTNGSVSTKKVVVRDANGNIVKEDVHKTVNNP